MPKAPLMPKATAVWLVDNTSLTFDQVADFCVLHVLEVKGIADGDVAAGIKGADPITSGQLTRGEIERGQADPAYRLKLAESKIKIPEVKTKRGPRYTPVSRRQDRPNAIQWLLRHHPEMKDAQVMRLVGTTKPTIQAIRERTHWNSANLQPIDPVTLSLCSQIDLDHEVQRAAKRVAREQKAAGIEVTPGATLLPAEETTAAEIVTAEEMAAPEAEPKAEHVFGPGPDKAPEPEPEEEIDADSVFAKLKELKMDEEPGEEDAGKE